MVLNFTVQNSHTLQKVGIQAYYQQSEISNEDIDRGVRTMKNLFSKERDPGKGLLAYRSTPLACKFSSAQLLMGREIRNSVPVFHTSSLTCSGLIRKSYVKERA